MAQLKTPTTDEQLALLVEKIDHLIELHEEIVEKLTNLGLDGRDFDIYSIGGD